MTYKFYCSYIDFLLYRMKVKMRNNILMWKIAGVVESQVGHDANDTGHGTYDDLLLKYYNEEK